jgi:hypothetical protein
MPNKHNDERHHHISKMKFRVTNWSAYEAGLRRRGSLTLWVSDDVIAAWRAPSRKTPGGQACYSETAIETALTLRAVFRLAMRQTEGLIGSILQLLGLNLPVPEPVRASAATASR